MPFVSGERSKRLTHERIQREQVVRRRDLAARLAENVAQAKDPERAAFWQEMLDEVRAKIRLDDAGCPRSQPEATGKGNIQPRGGSLAIRQR